MDDTKTLSPWLGLYIIELHYFPCEIPLTINTQHICLLIMSICPFILFVHLNLKTLKGMEALGPYPHFPL